VSRNLLCVRRGAVTIKTTPADADLIRLRNFLQRLESDARHAVEDAELWEHQIERLKGETAYLEAARSKAFLAQIGIDYGAARVSPLELIQRGGAAWGRAVTGPNAKNISEGTSITFARCGHPQHA
jgi:hypothetical protein